MARTKKILAVVTDLGLYRKLEELLKRSSFEVNRVPSGAGALVLIGNAEYDLVLIQAPLVDLGLDHFLRALRSLDSHGRTSPLLVLAPDAHAPTLGRALRDERIVVLPVNAEEAVIQSTASNVLGVAARTSRRIFVELSVEFGNQRRVLQTGNISRSGMLLRGKEGPPPGAEVEIRFLLPGDPLPFTLAAEVVRRTDHRVEGLHGFAVRFLDVSEEDDQRLEAFVARSLGEAQAVS